MKIKADTHDLEMSLMRAAGTVALRLKAMVSGFSYEFALTAIQQTPLGDDELYLNLYKQREIKYGLAPVAGFARGSWQIDFDSKFQIQELYGDTSGQYAASAAKIQMMNYKLGQKVYIGNVGPYIMNLEGGYSDQAPEGIMKPTLAQVLTTYKIDLKRYYDSALI